MLPRKPGIYGITCRSNNKIYVGSAVNMYQRHHVHLHCLREKKHANIHLQRAWNKYGADEFVWEVLEEVDDLVALIEREQEWIDATQCFKSDVGFNICREARSALGVKRRPDSLQRMAAAKAKDWIVTDLDGKEHPVTNLSAFCRQHGLRMEVMSRIAYGRGKSHQGGWRCRFASMSAEQWADSLRPMRDTRFKPKRYRIKSPAGKSYDILNLTKFCRKRGLNPTAFVNVAKGRWRQYRGWTCTYLAQGA